MLLGGGSGRVLARKVSRGDSGGEGSPAESSLVQDAVHLARPVESSRQHVLHPALVRLRLVGQCQGVRHRSIQHIIVDGRDIRVVAGRFMAFDEHGRGGGGGGGRFGDGQQGALGGILLGTTVLQIGENIG
jgi:hypothetical protein